MATVILRQEGGSHSFEERHIRMEDTDYVTVGRSTETSKPDNGNAIFSSAAISKEHAVFWFDKHARRFYLRNQESSTGCLLNEENVGQCAAVELINGDRVVFGHSEGAVRAIVMLEVVEDEVEDDDIQSQSLHAVHKEAEWRAMMQMEDKLYKENKEKEKKKQKEKEKEAVLDLNTEY